MSSCVSQVLHQEYLLDLREECSAELKVLLCLVLLIPTDTLYHTAARHKCECYPWYSHSPCDTDDQTLLSPAFLPILESTQTQPCDNNTDFYRGSPQTSLSILHPCEVLKEVLNFHFAGNKVTVPKVFFIKHLPAEARAVSRFLG